MLTFLLQFKPENTNNWTPLKSNYGFNIEVVSIDNAEFLAQELSKNENYPSISNVGNPTWKVINSRGVTVWEK